MKKYNVSGKLFLTLGFVFLSLICSGQKDRKDLEAQRKTLESQIKSTTDILAKTQKNKTKSLQQLKALNAQIRQRQELLESINNELKQVDKEAAVQEKNKTEAEKAINQLDIKIFAVC